VLLPSPVRARPGLLIAGRRRPSQVAAPARPLRRFVAAARFPGVSAPRRVV